MLVGTHGRSCTGPKYGFNDARRPQNVPADSKLTFEVELLRFEKEKSVHEMTIADRLEYAEL